MSCLGYICVVARYVSLLLSLVFLSPVWAEDDSDWLLARYQSLRDNPEAWERAYNAGRERATLCSYCHGTDGNSVKDDVPNLAGQNPLYLWTQINHFARGKRKNFVMEALAKNFTHEDKLNLAIYFSANKVDIQKADSGRAKKGGILYSRNCAACHGDSAHGSRNFARLAGQKPAYLVQTLKMVRKGAGAVKGAAVPEVIRRSENMEAVAGALSDEDILNLAAFLSSQS